MIHCWVSKKFPLFHIFLSSVAEKKMQREAGGEVGGGVCGWGSLSEKKLPDPDNLLHVGRWLAMFLFFLPFF